MTDFIPAQQKLIEAQKTAALLYSQLMDLTCFTMFTEHDEPNIVKRVDMMHIDDKARLALGHASGVGEALMTVDHAMAEFKKQYMQTIELA